jgi:GntR family transcriptional regulator
MIERGAYPDRVGALVAGMDLEQGSITERLEELGVVFADAEHVIDAVPASAEDARLLGVSPRVPMLRERRLTTDLGRAPVEWSDDRYLGSAVAFSVHNSTAVNALSRTRAHRAEPGDRPPRSTRSGPDQGLK